MKQEEIINGNKLIAEFLYPYNNYSTFYIPEHTFIEIKYGEYDSHEIFSIDELKYHSSWDWLMPCIGKISNECEEPEELDGLKYALLCNDIDTAWRFVVDYLTSSQKVGI